jgi:hypothetical protein
VFTKYVGLVSEDSAIDFAELSAVAAALQKQVTRDFAPLWQTNATVTAFARLEDLPLDYWPIIIMDDINAPGAAGYHDDDHGQPFSLVQYSAGWSLTASHELLEMLGDPFGRRMVAGQSPIDGQGRVKFLVEVCDPSEGRQFAYRVNGITVSDFYTPHYFDPVKAPGVRYSYTNSIQEPRQVLRGGYLSWFNPADGRWWQRTWFGGTASKDRKLSLNIQNGNIRAAIDRETSAALAKALPKTKALTEAMGLPPLAPAFVNNAEGIRASIKAALKY